MKKIHDLKEKKSSSQIRIFPFCRSCVNNQNEIQVCFSNANQIENVQFSRTRIKSEIQFSNNVIISNIQLSPFAI